MKKGFKLFLLASILTLNAFISLGQTSNLVGDNIVAFYPSNFDFAENSPSFIFKNDLNTVGTVPSTWSVKPEFSIENGKNVVRIPYTGSIDFYGNGEVSGALRRNGTEVTLWNTDNPAFGVDNGKRLYQSHPWIMGVRPNGTAFGIIADNTWKQSFEIINPITITSDGPGFRVIVIERDSPQELLKVLTDLTGKIELPALWTLGFQQSRFSYTPDTKVKSIADEFRNRKIPCDVIWMDIDYMDKYKVFTFNPVEFSDPKGLNDYLHSKNFKAVYMIDPGVKTEPGYFVYDQGTDGNHWIKNADGSEFNGQVWPPVVSFPDFTRPQTRTWWSGLYKNFMATGMDGVWNDMNEPSVFNTPNKTLPENALHSGGGDLPAGPHLRYHNVYGYLMVKASREGILAANPSKRPFVLSRSNFLGGQQYAATWTGDNSSTWEHLKLSIPMSITLGLSGQPISGPDIGGFTGNCTADLLGHWMAIGAYYPFSRNHTISGSLPQEPWAFGTQIENVSRTAINRRYRLLPYMYTLLREASETGMPLMRPVFFADNTDLNLRNEQQAFMLGKDLLVVPRWAKNPNLPKGNWNKITLESTEDDRYQSLLFVRPGAVIPVGEVIQSTVDYKSDKITYLINPLEDGTAAGELYHDDGDGFGYKTNDYATHGIYVTKHNADSLKVVINQIGGSKNMNRTSRIGYVTDNGIVFSAWSTSMVRYIPIIKDNKPNIDLSMVNSMFIKGSFNADAAPMINVGVKKWKLDSLNLTGGQTYTFKFIQSKDLPGLEWGDAAGLTGTAIETTDGHATISFKVPTTDNYSITFDQVTLKYTIQKTPVLNSLVIVGDATEIGWDSKGLQMQQSIDNLNVFTWMGTLATSNGSTEGKFKFHSGSGGFCDDVWLYATTADQFLSGTSFVKANGCSVPDNKWKVPTGETGTYKIIINLETNSINIEKLPSALAIVGDATTIGWDAKGLPMQQSADQANIYTWTGTLTPSDGTTEGKFKIHAGGGSGWCDGMWLHSTVADQALSEISFVTDTCTDPDNKWKVQSDEKGTYKIIVDVDAKKIKIEKIITTLAIVGDATTIGWDPKGLLMQQSDDNNSVFTWTGVLTENGSFKFHSGNNGLCDDIWLYATVPDQSISDKTLTIENGCTIADNKWKVQPGETGTYKITVDVVTKQINIQKVILESLAIVGDATSIGWDTKGLLMEQSFDNLNLFTWIGILSATNGTTEGKFKFHSGSGGFCDDVWLTASVADQSLSDTEFVKADGCTAPDNKWKVKAEETGIYKVTVNLETNKIVFQNITKNLGLTSSTKEIFFLYPNPVGNTLFFSTEIEVTKVSIFSPTGSLVLEQEVSNNNSVDVSKLNTGVYFIIANIKGKQIVKKFIKE
ncbi:TIM-barrel domain-containing protein [Flavivirga sp. 57AJ16]|uniref:TIM-barrel domain-containing protein n=1 Tax=Flavivirga sp. 57AJ16 TaxID=3025307 RepID=UPI0023660681|nr:TIM-barrel domain-containing protein [Flavivirga sp. 57AJ16]MDD7885384.1 glycoside hydrolase family 31 protein [Flavivirga sp. 57AJ16]